MAKALIGHLTSDPRAARFADENRRLRTRVSDLENVVLRLQAENDQLRAELEDRVSVEHVSPEMLPA